LELLKVEHSGYSDLMLVVSMVASLELKLVDLKAWTKADLTVVLKALRTVGKRDVGRVEQKVA
jgi:hypothetical protein